MGVAHWCMLFTPITPIFFLPLGFLVYYYYYYYYYYLLCFLCFLSFTSLFSVFSLVHCCYLLCMTMAFYTACCDKIYHFYTSTTFGLLWVSFLDCPLVCWLPNHHHYPMLAEPRFIPRQKFFYFVFLLPLALLSG